MTDVPDAGGVRLAIDRASARVACFGHAIDGCEVVVWAERRPGVASRFGVQIYLDAAGRDFFVNRAPAEEDVGGSLEAAFESLRRALDGWWRAPPGRARSPRGSMIGA
jgi:hypothetical protein